LLVLIESKRKGKKCDNNFGLAERFLRSRFSRKVFPYLNLTLLERILQPPHHAFEFERKSNDILLGFIVRERFTSKYKV
jgi:hypothetical protein